MIRDVWYPIQTRVYFCVNIFRLYVYYLPLAARGRVNSLIVALLKDLFTVYFERYSVSLNNFVIKQICEFSPSSDGMLCFCAFVLVRSSNL